MWNKVSEAAKDKVTARVQRPVWLLRSYPVQVYSKSKSYSCGTGQKISNSDCLPLLNLGLLPNLLVQPVLVAPLAHHLRLVFSIKLVFIKLIFSQSLPRPPFYTQADWEGCHGSWHSCSRHCGSSNHPRFSQSVVVMEKWWCQRGSCCFWLCSVCFLLQFNWRF